MIRTIIIEDEVPAALRLKKLLTEVDPSIEVLDILESVSSSVRWFGEHTPPDLLMLDIQLADGLSFDIFKEVQVESFIIFTTAFDEYAIKAFELNSIAYLLKPVDRGKLEQAIDKFKKLTGAASAIGRRRVGRRRNQDIVLEQRDPGRALRRHRADADVRPEPEAVLDLQRHARGLTQHALHVAVLEAREVLRGDQIRSARDLLTSLAGADDGHLLDEDTRRRGRGRGCRSVVRRGGERLGRGPENEDGAESGVGRAHAEPLQIS